MMSGVFVVWRAVPAFEKSGSSVPKVYGTSTGTREPEMFGGGTVYCRGGRYNRYNYRYNCDSVKKQFVP